jgi:hypothetical protein
MERNKIKRSYLEAPLTSPVFAVVVQVTSSSGVVHILLFAGRVHLFLSRSRLLTDNSNLKNLLPLYNFRFYMKNQDFWDNIF